MFGVSLDIICWFSASIKLVIGLTRFDVSLDVNLLICVSKGMYVLEGSLTSDQTWSSSSPKTLKNWVGFQWCQSYLIPRRCLFCLGWPPFYWWCHNKNTLWGRCFTSTCFTPHLFLLGWLKLNLALLDQLRLPWGDERWWQLWLVLKFFLFWLSQTWPITLRIQE